MVMLFLSSCQKHKKEVEQLNAAKDSIQDIVDNRNDMILDYVVSFNEIQQNLDSIKRVQKLVNVNLDESNTEIQKSEKDKIIKDIALINDLLEQNKKLVTQLQRKLKASNVKIAELEQMIESYVVQIEEKDAEITELSAQIGKMKINISELNTKVENLSEESREKTEMLKQQADLINTGWFCFGSKQELIENNIVEYNGGFIGLGRTLKLKPDFNQDYFNKIDIRTFSEIVLMVKKAEVITVHPDSAYRFETNDKIVERFIIEEPTEFWKTSKYLVLLVQP
jgi:chromosome segregation ATPase